MSTHSRILARRIPQTEELRRLVGYSPWGHKESDVTGRLKLSPLYEVGTVIISSIPFLEISKWSMVSMASISA